MSFKKQAIAELGFSSWNELGKSIVGVKSTIYVVAQSGLAGMNVFLAFANEWIWSPPRAILLIVILVVTETITGSIIAVKTGEEFNVSKFGRGFIILLVQIAILAMAHNIAKVEPALFWLTNAFFGWFICQAFLKVLKDLVVLKLLRGGFVDYFKDKLNLKDEVMIKNLKKDLEKNNQESE